METSATRRHDGDLPLHFRLEDVVRAIALMLSNQIVYGKAHRLSEDSFRDSYERLSGYLAEHGNLLIGGAKGHLIANTRYIELKTRNLQTLAQCLEEREITALELLPGCTAYEYHELIDLLSMPPVTLDGYGGVTAYLDKRKVESIRLIDVNLENSAEHETVTQARQVTSSRAYIPGDPEQDAAAILEYLDSPTPEAAERASVAVGGLISDAHLIAEVIFRAATARSGDEMGGCDFEVLVDCVRSVTDVITGCQSAETSAGRLMLIGTLDDLREELLFAIQADDEDSDFAQRTLTRIIENVKERLSIEKMFAEYGEKRRMLRSRERRIIDFLRNKGFGLSPSELEHRLKRQGITDELWDELWDKSFRRSPSAVKKFARGAVDRFEKFARKPSGKESADFVDELINNMADVELEMISLVEQTRARIDALGGTFSGALQSPSGPSREHVQELARALLTIGHGLSEPIKMLSTSVEIVRSSSLGRLNEAQHAVLQMAAISGKRLQALTNQLMGIAEENQT